MAQWVVTVRPSSSPAEATAKAPVQMEAMRIPARPHELESGPDPWARRAPEVLEARDDDRVRFGERLETRGEPEGETCARGHGLLGVAAHGELVGGVRTGVEDLRGDPQIHGQHAVDRQNHDPMLVHGRNITSAANIAGKAREPPCPDPEMFPG